MEGVIVRKYKKEDRPFVRRIVYDTAAIGESAEFFFEDREILADFLSKYFTDYEPQSCFVAVSNEKIIGYLFGAKDSTPMKVIYTLWIFPQVFVKSIIRGTFLKKKNFIFLFLSFFALLRGGYNTPSFHKLYPAVLHINLKADFRGESVGAKLMRAYFNYLYEEKVRGVHLRTMSARAGGFFDNQGFKLLMSKRELVFSKILKNSTFAYFYGKRLL